MKTISEQLAMFNEPDAGKQVLQYVNCKQVFRQMFRYLFRGNDPFANRECSEHLH